MPKDYKDTNVYEASKQRMDYIFSEFDRIYLSVSFGKDSGVMLNMAIEAARKHGKLPVNVLFVDLEAQYKHTISYAERMMALPEVNPYWVALPIHLRNAVSQIQSHWLCWDPEKKDAWVRDMPEQAISDENYFSFFRRGMEFEDFVPEFADWFSNGEKTACLVGIRSDESLNRFRTIRNDNKIPYDGKIWSTKLFPDTDKEIYNFYPLYDWRTEDIWIANGRFGWDYNKIYDLMYLAGVSIHKQRLCQPFGDDQRNGLYLFKILEPETWRKVVNRVEGANFGNRYSETDYHTLGNFRINLPPGHTYKSYAKFLLRTMPPYLEQHYREKIYKFLKWHRDHWREIGMTMQDTADPRLESKKKAPSWRRVVKVLLKNDYWCKGLSFSQTKKDMERQARLIMKYQNTL
ncbi:MAG: phosphoadenosine phosphosulfate reductase [Bacteroidota bacterium]